MSDEDATPFLIAMRDAVPGMVDQAAAEAAGEIRDVEVAKTGVGAALSGARRWEPDPPLNLWEGVFQAVVAGWAGQAEPGEVVESCDLLRAHHLRLARRLGRRPDCDAFTLGFWAAWTSGLLRAVEVATLREISSTHDASRPGDRSRPASQHTQIRRGIRTGRQGL